VGVGVAVGVKVGVGVDVGVAVGRGVRVGLAVGVKVSVAVGVRVAVGLGTGNEQAPRLEARTTSKREVIFANWVVWRANVSQTTQFAALAW
jgi:hypothetical protein